jgi:hypothetical protein
MFKVKKRTRRGRKLFLFSVSARGDDSLYVVSIAPRQLAVRRLRKRNGKEENTQHACPDEMVKVSRILGVCGNY